MNNILTSISLEKTVQSSLQLDKKKAKKKYTRHTIESVKADIESFQGYQLLSTEYLSYKKKLDILCPQNHRYMVTYGNFQSGNRCPECSIHTKHTLESAKQYIESFGYQLLSTEYVGANAKLDVLCPAEHLYKVSYANFQSGRRCLECARIAKRRTMLNGEEWKPENRSGKADRDWVKAVKERDGQVCQVCHSSKNLCAHHIESYSKNPELQTDINNGVTLCKPCHTAIHSRYGVMTATRADLEKFIRFKLVSTRVRFV